MPCLIDAATHCEDAAGPSDAGMAGVRTLDELIAPFVKDRGYEWEISIDETPFDLWSLQGEFRLLLNL